MDIIKNAMNFIPHTWRKRRETEVETEAKIQASTSMIPKTVQGLIGYGLPREAAWDAALQISGIPNTESVLSRLTPSDWEKLPTALGKSEALVPAIYATRTASNESLRDLLEKIIKGELENPSVPRSTVEIVNSLSKGDIENFLLLRRVLWEEYRTPFFDEPIPSIYCMEDSRAYPGLLDNQQMSRLVHLRLIYFGTAPFESYFPEGGSEKNLGFGNKHIRISSATPSKTLGLGHFALTSDGRNILDLFRGEPCEMMYSSYESSCSNWSQQGFNVQEIQVIR